MEIIALKAHNRGYHGCLVDENGYMFFQYSLNGRFRPLKRYPESDFQDLDQFVAIMSKYMSLTAFLNPPVPIAEMSLPELDRVWQINRQRTASLSSS